MSISVGAPTLVALLLVVARVMSFLIVAPPFNTNTVPMTVKGALALAVALPVFGRLTAQAPTGGTLPLVSAAVLQVFVGAALGFAVLLLFAAVQAAGSLIDLFGGFSLAQGFDPLAMTQNTVFGRLHQLLAVMLLFAANGHLLLLRGLAASFDAVPLDSGISLGTLGHVLTTGLVQLFLAALQIAAPLVGVLFLADVGLGLLTRVAPSLNVFAVGFPLKILLTLILVGFTLPLLPRGMESILDSSLRAMHALLGGG